MASGRYPASSNDFKLPSLKDLNFPYQPEPQQKRPRVVPRPPHPPQYAAYPQQPFPDQVPSYSYQSPYIPPRPVPPHPASYPSPAQPHWLPPHLQAPVHQPPPPPTAHISPHALAHHPPPHVAHLPPAPLHPPQQQQQQQQQPQPQPQHQQQQSQQHQHQQPQSFSRSSTIASAVDDIDNVARSPPLRDGLMVEACALAFVQMPSHIPPRSSSTARRSTRLQRTMVSQCAFPVRAINPGSQPSSKPRSPMHSRPLRICRKCRVLLSRSFTC